MISRKLLPILLVAIVTATPIRTGSPDSVRPPAPPPSAALREILRSGRLEALRWPAFANLSASLSKLYEDHGYSLLWFAGDRLNDRAIAAVDVLGHADETGLNPDDYDAARLSRWTSEFRQPSSPPELGTAQYDMALTISLMRYASALHQGRINPRQVRFSLRQKDALDAAAFVHTWLHSGENLATVLSTIEPPFRGYQRTRAALAHYLQLAAKGDGDLPAPPRRPLRPGQPSADLPALAARLALLGDLTAPAAEAGQTGRYDEPLVSAVRHFQSRHGLAPTGILDTITYRELATPLAQRVEQLQLTLERWRWLPSSVLPAIAVNIPEFELRAFEQDGSVALRMHVIVGKAYRHRTPVFEDRLQSVIVRPNWNVPPAIQRAEIVPALRADPAWLGKHDMVVVDEKNQQKSGLAGEDLLQQLATGKLRVRQVPGPQNSLGLLKFHFPNDYSVYMHGTPAQKLFSRSRRDFSHGCIRVEDPVSLAEWVLRDEPGWNREKILTATAGTRTIEIPVHRPIAVLILYATAVVEENGEVYFYDDLYGYDAELSKALAPGYLWPDET